jgi:ABC-type multidrug transport system permease subunit
MSTILSAPLSNQIQVPFITTRNIYEVRERPSRMYSWTALITSQILGELPFNIVGSSIYFLVWYWLVGFPTDRGGYTYLMIGVVYPLYYTTIAQAIAAMAPNAEIAALLFGFLFSFVLTLYVSQLTILFNAAYNFSTAMVSCNRSDSLDGGSGCTDFQYALSHSLTIYNELIFYVALHVSHRGLNWSGRRTLIGHMFKR